MRKSCCASHSAAPAKRCRQHRRLVRTAAAATARRDTTGYRRAWAGSRSSPTARARCDPTTGVVVRVARSTPQQEESPERADRAGRERAPVAAELRDRAAHQCAEPLRQIEERRERADDRRPLGVVHTVQREQQQRRIHERHARREHDRPEHQPDNGGPRRDQPDAGGGHAERQHAGVAPAESVGQRAAKMRTARINTP